MIWLSPKSVSLMGRELSDVRAITASQSARRVIEEWSDEGPYAVLVDAAEVSVEIVIEREIRAERADLTGELELGEMGELSFAASPSGSSAHEERVTATVVATSIRHTLHGGSGPRQTIACRAVTDDGSRSPLALPNGGK